MSAPHPLIEHLTGLRKQEGLTQRALAARLGYSPSALMPWEAGRSTPTVDVLEDYASALGLSLALVPADPGLGGVA